MNGEKPLWASKTFWATAAMVLTSIATALKYDIGDPMSLGLLVSGLLSSALALYGRIKAVKKIGSS